MSKGEKILIIGNEKEAIEELSVWLKDYQVLCTDTESEAQQIITLYDKKLKLILVEVASDINEGAFISKIMASNEDSNRAIVALTSAGDGHLDEQLWNMGVCGIIHKPYCKDVVVAQIHSMMHKIHQQEQRLLSYDLQKILFHQNAGTVFCIYDIHSGEITLQAREKEALLKHFNSVFGTYPFRLEKLVLPKNQEHAAKFFDVKNKPDLYEEMEIRLKIDKGHYEWFKVSVIIQCDEQGNRRFAAFLFINIEHQVEAEERLLFMAKHDTLTHIPNMRTFALDVREMLERYPKDKFVMVSVDIDQFRLMNKLFGYNEGDNVLKYLATKLQELVESYEKGVYCRMASDVFYACIPDEEEMLEIYNHLQEELALYPLKFDLKLCFGVYSIEDASIDVESMIEHSAFARTSIKKNPHQYIQFYDATMKKKEYFETVVISEAEQALREHQFQVVYQPKCDARTKKIIGSEALIRWNHPEQGAISPGIFVPIFEEHGLVTELDYYVYESVCKTLRQWLDEGLEPVPVSVNVSRCDFYDSQLLQRIVEIVDRYEVPHHLIEFEITESAFIIEKSPLVKFTNELRRLGFKSLIDDFGSGYSSLNFLKNIEVDVLKIDIAFLPVSTEEEKSPIILEEIINMAKKLNLEVIAEGVETQQQLELLISLGCEMIQGYYFYRPLPVEEIKTILIEQNR